MKRNKRKTILFVTQLHPFPPNMGGTFRTSGTLKTILSLGHKISLVSFTDKTADSDRKNSTRKLYKNLQVYKIPGKIIEDFHPRLRFKRFLKSLMLLQPYKATKYYSKQASGIIQKILITHHPQIIYLDHLSSAVYLPIIKRLSPSSKIILDIHDIESQLSFEKFLNSKSAFLKSALLLEYLKSRFFEAKILNKVDKIFVLSQAAKNFLKSRVSTPISIIPISLFETKTPSQSLSKKENLKNYKQLTFIGTLSLDVNKDGLQWFIEKVWPLVKTKIPQVKLAVAGSYGQNSSLKKILSADGILYLGYRQNLEPVYQQTDIGIIPMLVGGTVRMKTLGFLAHGVPVVSTPAGVYGIPKIKNQVHCLIANSAEEFADKTVKLLKNSHQREKLSQAAIKLMINYYTFDNLQRFLNYELSRLRA